MDYREFLKEYESKVKAAHEFSRRSIEKDILCGKLRTLHITPSSGCNLSCTYCISQKNILQQKMPDWDFLKRKFDAIFSNFGFENKIKIHVLFGGEFSLYQDEDSFPSLLKYIFDRLAIDNKIVTGLYLVTNGMNPLTDYFIKFLKNLNCDIEFSVSYDGTDDINDAYRRDKTGAIKVSGQVKKFVSSLKEHGFGYKIHSTITDKWNGMEDEVIFSLKRDFSSATKCEMDFVSVHDFMPDVLFERNKSFVQESSEETILRLHDYSKLYGLKNFSMRLDHTNLTDFCHFCHYPVLNEGQELLSCSVFDTIDIPEDESALKDSILLGEIKDNSVILKKSTDSLCKNLDYVPNECLSCDVKELCGAKYCKWMWQNFKRYGPLCYYAGRYRSGMKILYNYDIINKFPRILKSDSKTYLEFLSIRKELVKDKNYFTDYSSLLISLWSRINSTDATQVYSDKIFFLYDKSLDESKLRLMLPLIIKAGLFVRILNYVPLDDTLIKSADFLILPETVFDSLDIVVFESKGDLVLVRDLLSGQEFPEVTGFNKRYYLKERFNEMLLSDVSNKSDYDALNINPKVLERYSSESLTLAFKDFSR